MDERIHMSIVDKEGSYWRIIGICPEWVSESGGLHIYRGPNAVIRDCDSNALVMTGRSLRDVIQKLADKTGLMVKLEDELTWKVTTFTPAGSQAGARS